MLILTHVVRREDGSDVLRFGLADDVLATDERMTNWELGTSFPGLHG